MTTIRNISQTHMERDMVKTAPDMVVYINDLPNIENPYLGTEGTSISFNDYITDIQGNCDADALIPTASITMSVPNHYMNLFMAPGGNKILSTMSTVKIFSKGYYFDKDGNSIYYRVFYGIIDSIGYSYTGTTMQISINCKGIMRLLELVQTNVAPSTLNFGLGRGLNVTAFRTIDNDKSALAIIYKNIFTDLDANLLASAFQETTIQRANNPHTLDTKITNDNLVSMIKSRYINRWKPVLDEIKLATRIFGFNYKDIDHTNLSDPVIAQKFFTFQSDAVKDYLPEYAIGDIALLESKITSRLERISTMSAVTGYEGFQDLNGNIIFKPPLYNLDVTLTDNIASDQNPFIINLDEITDESEQEDEQAIRATRVTVKGQPWRALLADFPADILPGVASYTDMNLFSKFGLREEPPKEITWLEQNDKVNYA
jgi:hypothetical protein